MYYANPVIKKIFVKHLLQNRWKNTSIRKRKKTPFPHSLLHFLKTSSDPSHRSNEATVVILQFFKGSSSSIIHFFSDGQDQITTTLVMQVKDDFELIVQTLLKSQTKHLKTTMAVIWMQATLDVQQKIIPKPLVNRHSLVLIGTLRHNWLLAGVSTALLYLKPFSHYVRWGRKNNQKQSQEVVYKIGVFKDFAKFTGKHLNQCLFF